MANKIAKWILSSHCSLALDIGSKYIKVMQFEQSGGVPVLHVAAIAPVPEGAIENGIIANKSAVVATLRKMLDKNQILGSEVWLAAGGPNLVLRWIEMPQMSEDDLREALKYEARKYLPFPIEHGVVDFKILSRKAKQPEETLRILLIAAPRALVDSRFEAVEAAGLKPIGMDVEPLAVLRALEHDPTRSELAWDGHPRAILVFGSAGTDFYVTKGSDLEFARRIPIGGRNLAKVIADNQSLDLAQTDERDIVRKISFDTEGRVLVDNADAQLRSAIESEITRLDHEIERSCSYYQSLFPEGSYEGVLTQVTIAGGLAAMDGFQTHLTHEIDMVVDVADPLARISLKHVSEGTGLLNGNRTLFIVSAGLLLGQLAD